MINKADLLTTPSQFFAELLEEGFQQRKIKASPLVSDYLVGLLTQYLHADKLHEGDNQGGSPTLAEMYLRAAGAESALRAELYKRLGDTALYISGVFGDSLNRKVVDIDYYAEIGGSAYAGLAAHSPADPFVIVYEEFSFRFMSYVDLLTYVSQKSFIQSDRDLLRLYDRYVNTGSELAREQLVEKGLIAPLRPNSKMKIAQ